MPEPNPTAARTETSLAGVSHNIVKERLIDVWFPPKELDRRTATSRTDGYWPYLQQGKDPPKELTYGEFDFFFFAALLDQAGAAFQEQEQTDDDNKKDDVWANRVFVDLGSGAGRLVLSAAALHPNMKVARGVELLPGLHQAAVGMWNEIQNKKDSLEVEDTKRLPLAPMELVCASFDDPYDTQLWDSSLVFCFSTCLPTSIMEGLTHAVGRQCRPGTLVITTDTPLHPLKGRVPPVEDDSRIPFGDYEIHLLQEIPGWSWIQGGETVAYLHRVERSCLWRDGKKYTLDDDKDGPPWERPKLSVEELCYRAAMALEERDPQEIERFLRGAYNNCVFYGLPERFYARLRDRFLNSGNQEVEDRRW